MNLALFFKIFSLHIGLGLASFFSFLGVTAPVEFRATPHTFGTTTVSVPLVPTPLKPEGLSFPSASEAEAPKKTAEVPVKTLETSTPPPLPPAETPAPIPPSGVLNDRVRDAVVNILCIGVAGSGVPSISGSGIIIDPRGVILTNAHVAQLFLLKDYPSKNSTECVIRTGSPARSTYKAELLFISSSWVRQNYHALVEQDPLGTGEHDFALLHITGRTNPQATLPSSFPYLELDAVTEEEEGSSILLVGYPAGFLDSEAIQKNLYAVSSPATITHVYTFGGNTPDLISTGGTIVAQKGSSGGAVVQSGTGKLIGMFVTSTEADTTGERDLRAITIPYIERSYIEEEGRSLTSLLTGDIAGRAEEFNVSLAPTLTQILTSVLRRN